MVIRTYENCEIHKGALIHNCYRYYLIHFFCYGEFKGEKRYKRFKKAQKECIKYINK